MGRLKKGGIPDQITAARVVLNDWNNGKIKYYTYPPEDEKTNLSENDTVMQDAEIVSEFAKEFSLDDMNITKMESDDMQNLPNILPSQTMLIPTSGILNEQQNDDMSDIESSDQESGSMGKENLLSNKISIGGNANNRNASNKVDFLIDGLLKNDIRSNNVVIFLLIFEFNFNVTTDVLDFILILNFFVVQR